MNSGESCVILPEGRSGFSFAAGSLEAGFLLLQDCFKQGFSQSEVIARTAADAPFTYSFPYRWPDCALLSNMQNMMLWLILELFSLVEIKDFH